MTLTTSPLPLSPPIGAWSPSIRAPPSPSSTAPLSAGGRQPFKDTLCGGRG
jgi:hypothetical protein